MDKLAALTSPRPWADPDRGDAPLFGRRAQLAALAQHLQDAQSGQARVIFLQGEVGMGKTRLLCEVQALAQHQGLQITQGHCYEDFELLYFPVVEALRSPLQHFAVRTLSVVPIDERHIRHFHIAISVAMRTGARPELGRTYLDYARMRMARAQAGDRPHAISLARHAEHLLQTLGMISWGQDAQRFRQGLQALQHPLRTAYDTDTDGSGAAKKPFFRVGLTAVFHPTGALYARSTITFLLDKTLFGV